MFIRWRAEVGGRALNALLGAVWIMFAIWFVHWNVRCYIRLRRMRRATEALAAAFDACRRDTTPANNEAWKRAHAAAVHASEEFKRTVDEKPFWRRRQT